MKLFILFLFVFVTSIGYSQLMRYHRQVYISPGGGVSYSSVSEFSGYFEIGIDYRKEVGCLRKMVNPVKNIIWYETNFSDKHILGVSRVWKTPRTIRFYSDWINKILTPYLEAGLGLENENKSANVLIRVKPFYLFSFKRYESTFIQLKTFYSFDYIHVDRCVNHSFGLMAFIYLEP